VTTVLGHLTPQQQAVAVTFLLDINSTENLRQDYKERNKWQQQMSVKWGSPVPMQVL
jgi:hypothetical protein